MTKRVDRAVAHRDMRVSRAKAKAKTVDVGAWKSHKESWYEKLNQYQERRKELNANAEIDSNTGRFSPVDVNKMQLITNDIEICLLNIDICEMQIKIAELQQHNIKLKTNLM